MWVIGKGFLPEHRSIGSPVPSWNLFTCWTRKLPMVWGLSLWIGICTLVVPTGYMILVPEKEKRISHVSSEFSTKENTFLVSFEGWKIHTTNQGSESKRQHMGIFLEIVGEIYLDNRQQLLSWTKIHWGWCLFIELNILCTHDASNLLYVMFLKCPFCPVHKN